MSGDLDTAVLSRHDYLVYVVGSQDDIAFSANGQLLILVQAESIRRLAQKLGSFERVSRPSLDMQPSLAQPVRTLVLQEA